MENRKYVYAFKNCHGNTSIVNYDGGNSDLNTFLSMFDVWSSRGEFKYSEDKNHVDVWFEALPEMLNMLHTMPFKTAFERMGVKLVFECPFMIGGAYVVR